MKVALLLTGQPRFCADFDDQLRHLSNSSCIDWYAAFWKQLKHHAFEEKKDKWISPAWDFEDNQSMLTWLYCRIPNHHRIPFLAIKAPTDFPQMPEYPPLSCHSLALWGQYQILQFAAHHLDQSMQNYDLVIRSRPDIGLTAPLDLKKCHEYLLAHPHEILIPGNRRHGPAQFTDQFAIGLPQSMQLYCNAVDHFSTTFQKGVPWNPEYILGMTLKWQGLSWPMNDIRNTLRSIGEGEGANFKPHWGRWI